MGVTVNVVSNFLVGFVAALEAPREGEDDRNISATGSFVHWLTQFQEKMRRKGYCNVRRRQT